MRLGSSLSAAIDGRRRGPPLPCKQACNRPGGESRSARLNLEHGNYEILCTVGDHAELGMTGTLRVR